MRAHGYKVRRHGSRRNPYPSYAITVPNEFAEALPPGATFVPEMTDEGLVYRIQLPTRRPPRPSWAGAA